MSHNENYDLNFSIKVKVFNENPAFGPGVVRVLQLVNQTKSLSASYKAMGLSSSKGWKIIKRAEEDLGFPLIISSTGGKGGGYSELTEEGIDLLHRYQLFVDELDLEAKKIFQKHFNLK